MKKKVLLVSHESVTRTLMSTLIEVSCGDTVEVAEAMSCAEAIQKIRDERFDLVITNSRTGTDSATGFDVVREVRGKLDGSKVIIAAHCLSEEEQGLANLVHPDGFLQMPFDPRLFQYIVSTILQD